MAPLCPGLLGGEEPDLGRRPAPSCKTTCVKKRKFTFPIGEANQERMTPTPPLESLETLQPLFLAELGIQTWFVISPLLLPVSWDKINVCLFNLSSAILYCNRLQK